MNGFRWGIRFALLLALFVALLAARAVTSSRFELKIGDEKLIRGESDAAIDHYRRAARWYMPEAHTMSRHLDRLAVIAPKTNRAATLSGRLLPIGPCGGHPVCAELLHSGARTP